MNPKITETIFKKFRRIKYVQCIFLICFEVAYLLIVMMNPSLRNSMYTNPSLFALSLLIWVLLLMCFGFLLYDIRKMQRAVKANDDLDRLAHLDELTDIPNRYSCDQLLKSYEKGSEFPNLGVSMMEITDIRMVNEKNGREMGDRLVHDFAAILMKTGNKYGFVCRNGGNEFLAVFSDCDQRKMEEFYRDLDEAVTEYNADTNHLPLHYSRAEFLNCNAHVKTFSELAKGAHDALHRSSANNRV